MFFDSAQSKINIAFDTIVNQFPFDGTGKTVEAFFDSLTGYENYIFNIFPKYTGFLYFSGASEVSGNPAPDTDGTYIKVYDSRGYLFPNFSSKDDGSTCIDFGTNPFSFEYHLFVPEQINNNQIIFQKRLSRENCVTVALSSSDSLSDCKMLFGICSGSSYLFTSASIDKGKFNHIVNTFDRNIDNKAKIYLNAELASTSSKSSEFATLSFLRAPLFIGSGSSFSVDPGEMPLGSTVFMPFETLSGSLDEVRVFHTTRTTLEQKEYGKKSIYASDNLKLYFKLNEPTGSYTPNKVVLDSSGNSLHAVVANYKEELRVTGSLSNPMTYEKENLSPILFPDHYLIKNLNTRLLSSASIYDLVNPNIITNIVPPHLFLDGQNEEGLNTLQGEVFNPISGKSIPGSAKLGAAQQLTGFLFIYAKFFDELKIVIDSISNFLSVTYDDTDIVPDQLLPAVAKYYGISLPSLFSNSTIFEFIDGEDIGDDFGFSTRSLRELQNQLWKRFLINLPFLIQSKGTISNIKSTLRTFGINPDNLMNIREFGGPTKKSLKSLRQSRIKNLPLLDFSGSLSSSVGTIDYQGFSSTIPNIVSPFLSGSRIEPGFPQIQGAFVNKTQFLRNGISNNPEDGLFTSGSFTYEGYYRFLESSRTGYSHPVTQSLARIEITGSSVNRGAVIANLLAVSSSQPSLSLYVRSPIVIGGGGVKLTLSGAEIFNGDPWYISFGRNRSDEILTSVSESYLAPKLSNVGSSSYFIRCSRSSNGKIIDSFYKTKLFKDEGTGTAFENLSLTYNVSGTFLTIGSQSLGSYTNLFLNDASLDSVPGFSAGDREMATSTKFSGHVGKIRFWSGGLTRDDANDHTLNPSSIGSENPNITYNFISQNSGSFQRPRLDIQMTQPITASSTEGIIDLTNFTQQLGDVSGKGFASETTLLKNELIFYSMLSPKFDLSQTDEKVRIRSYQSNALIEKSDYAMSTPVYEVRKSETPDDDRRFAVEFSSVKALEDDIMSIFSDLIFFDNALGRPDLMFDEIYPDLDQARKVYFRRLFSKPEFQNYFSMFKWFNRSFGYIIEQLVPRNTKFLGVDFIYESHPLERNRFRYLFDEIYLLSNERSFDRGDILLSQYVGTVKKF